MAAPLGTSEAIQKATESDDPKALLNLYEEFEENAPVVKAIVNNRYCPDEVKKRYVVYALERRLPRSASQLGASGSDILEAMKKSLEAWQPIQRVTSTPDIAANDKEATRLLELAQRHKAVVLYGPPGTSKTYLARMIAKALTDADDSRVEVVQFHPSYNYEDFIEGIVPKLENGQVNYGVEDKVFKLFCERARGRASQRFIFIIDEINRADLSKVFGEIFSCLEYRGQPVQTLYKRTPFTIPSNVIVLGTMNLIDRSTTEIDFALRRRFYFFEVPPSAERLNQVLDAAKDSIDAGFRKQLVEAFSKTLSIYPLGHAYFKDVRNRRDLRDLWVHQLKPLLEQYFAFELGKVREIEREYQSVWASGEGE